MSSIVDLIDEEHRDIDALVEALASGSISLDAYDVLRARLLRHIAIEEKLILAAVRDLRGGEPIEGARRVRVEHGAIASLLVGTPDASLVRELRALLTAHEAFEDEGIYARCEAVLGPARSAEIAARARQLPSPPLARPSDGPLVPRTAESALRGAERMRFSRG